MPRSTPRSATPSKANAKFRWPAAAHRLARRFVIAAAALSLATPVAAQQVLRDAEIEEFLDDYSRPIFRAAGLPAEDIDIYIIGDQTPNAFAGGLIMGIHTGLITTADTPNQIEGVIAHEAGHIKLKHTVRSDGAAAAASRPIYLSLILAAGAIAAGAPEAGIGLLGLGQNIGLVNALKYSQGQESAADQTAVITLNSIGHSSQGLIEFFAKLRVPQVNTSRRINPYLQTHPLANARITALRENVEGSPYHGVKDGEEEIFRLNMIQAKIHGFLTDADDTLQLYPTSDESMPAHYARSVAYYRMSDLDTALGELQTLLDWQPDNPFFHELHGQILFEFGRVAESIEPHKRSVELDPAETLFRMNLGRAYLGTEDKEQYASAVREFKVALLGEPENPYAWYELSRAYGAMGDLPRADLSKAEASFYGGNPQQAVASAQRAMKGLEQGSPEWRRASDIVHIVASNLKNGRGRRR